VKKRELLVRVADLECKVEYLKRELDRLQKRVADLELAQSISIPSVWKTNSTWRPEDWTTDTYRMCGDVQWSYTTWPPDSTSPITGLMHWQPTPVL